MLFGWCPRPAILWLDAVVASSVSLVVVLSGGCPDEKDAVAIYMTERVHPSDAWQ